MPLVSSATLEVVEASSTQLTDCAHGLHFYQTVRILTCQTLVDDSPCTEKAVFLKYYPYTCVVNETFLYPSLKDAVELCM